jgi:hypothetical protein
LEAGSRIPWLLLARAAVEQLCTERSAIAKLVLEGTGKATTIAVLKGGIKQSIRNHLASLLFGFAPVKHAMADLLSEVAVGYPESPLNAHTRHMHGGPEPGKRAPIRENESPVGSGNKPLFALFGEPDSGLSVLIEKYAEILEPTLRPPFRPGGLWLVRPDGYVALSEGAENWKAVDTYLANLRNMA